MIGITVFMLVISAGTAQPVQPSTPPAAGEPAVGGRYVLGENSVWTPAAPAPGEDPVLAQARTYLAQGNPAQALRVLDPWITQHTVDPPPEMAEAYLRRGDAKVALADEMQALYDYERIIRYFPASEQFVLALERELEIAIRYLNGLRAKGWFGIRYETTKEIGEELLIRVQERLPGSQLAERAGIELADYYYRIRDLKMASEAYDIFLRNFPRSEYRQRAELRRIFSSIAQFKGPRYDAQPLREARERVKRYADRYPAEAEQSGVGDALATRLEESAATQQMEVGLWYLKQDNPVSAKVVFKRLFREFPNTVAARKVEQLYQERQWPLPTRPAAAPAPTETPAETPAEGATR